MEDRTSEEAWNIFNSERELRQKGSLFEYIEDLEYQTPGTSEEETALEPIKDLGVVVLRDFLKLARSKLRIKIKRLTSTHSLELKALYGRNARNTMEQYFYESSGPEGSTSYNWLLPFLCAVFNLSPQAQWTEALRLNFLPTIPRRINLFNEERLEIAENAFTDGTAGEAEIYWTAWFLILDAWLYSEEYYTKPSDSLLSHSLTTLTCTLDIPALKIAHCIRDLILGNRSRAKDLEAMITSNDPSYQSIFEACYWRLS